MNSLSIYAVVLVAGMVAGAILFVYAPQLARTASTALPMNFVPVSERIHTSGQPSAAQLGGLAEKGYKLVINLAPPTSAGSLADEGMLVAQAGIAYVNIPVDWHKPLHEDLALFSEILDRAGSRQALVHCQVTRGPRYLLSCIRSCAAASGRSSLTRMSPRSGLRTSTGRPSRARS